MALASPRKLGRTLVAARAWPAQRALGLCVALAQLGFACRAMATEVDARLGQIQLNLKGIEEQLRFVEEGFVAHLQSGSEQSQQERFGEAEVAYLIGDYGKATSLLYDVVLSPTFKADSRYLDGVFYLGESLRHQKDYLGAKHFLREVLERGPGSSHFDDALVGYLEVAARTNDFRDLDRYAELAERSGRVAPAVEYLLAKATFERTDLPEGERVRRALAAFQRVTPQSPFYLQALYFQGVCLVQSGRLTDSRDVFARVANAPLSADAAQKQIRELAFLAVGRVDYELGQYSEALDAYQNVPESSPAFFDALYEIAWTYVKKGDYESARKAVELLTLGAPEGSLLPEANLLRGQLLLKLGKYSDSEETYQQVIEKYAPVRDQIDQLLAVNGDPAAYFDKLLSQKSGSFDVTSLLPAAARGWATSQKEVREAQAVAQDLGDGRRGISESDAIVARLQKRMLDAASLEAFPALQAGNERASAVDAALLQAENQLVSLEQTVLSGVLTPGEQAELADLARRRGELEGRFANLPKSEGQLENRDQERLSVLREKEKALFKLSLLVQSLRAQSVAVQRLAEETRPQRQADPAAEKKFGEDVTSVLGETDAFDAQLSGMLRELRDAETVDTAGGNRGDAELRAAYAAALQREADLLNVARGRAPSAVAAQSQRIQTLREQVAQLRSRSATAMAQIRAAAVAQAGVIREKIAIESASLEGYRQEVSAAEGNASGLVGRIAYESFKRVRRQVYDLVLKADVGVVDVAWTRKRDDADKIQKLASDKDREVRVLDDDFREVLEEVH